MKKYKVVLKLTSHVYWERTVIIETDGNLNLDNSMIERIITKGRLFSDVYYENAWHEGEDIKSVAEIKDIGNNWLEKLKTEKVPHINIDELTEG